MIERDSTVLPEPDSPTMPRVLPRSTDEGHAVDGPHRAPAGAEGGVQVVDHEQRPGRLADVGELERRGRHRSAAGRLTAGPRGCRTAGAAGRRSG